MQHEMRGAVNEEHALRVKIDVGLQHGVKRQHANDVKRDAKRVGASGW